MGWGEAVGHSAELVRQSDTRRKADELAHVVAAYLAAPTMNNRDRLSSALDAYRSVRHG